MRVVILIITLSQLWICVPHSDAQTTEAFVVYDDGHGASLFHLSLSPEDSSLETVGTVDSVHAICMNRSMGLIGLDAYANRLVSIDPSTAAVTPIVDLDRSVVWSLSDIAFGPNGRLWMVNDGTLFLVDLEDGSTELVGNTGYATRTITMHREKLYGGGGGLIVEIDPETAESTVVVNFSGPWGYMSILGLSSDGRWLWTTTLGGGEPGPMPDCPIMIIDPSSGEFSYATAVPAPVLADVCTIAVAPRPPIAPDKPANPSNGPATMVLLILTTGAGSALPRPRHKTE